jgi:hypothetical protein
VLLHDQGLRYYGGMVSIGVDVDDGTGWGEVNQLLDANRSRTASPPGGVPATTREPASALRETATERSR